MIYRINQYRDWGINVSTGGVQNNPIGSLSGAQTCHWDPDQPANLIEKNFVHGLILLA